MTRQPTKVARIAKEIAGVNFAVLIVATLLYGGYVFVLNMIRLVVQ